MFQVESSKVCQYVNFLIRSMKIEQVPPLQGECNTELNCQYTNIPIRVSKTVTDTNS